MTNTLSHLNLLQRKELYLIVQKIAGLTGAEKIYCYGSRVTHVQRWSPFQANRYRNRELYFYSYDMALIMPAGEEPNKEQVLHELSGAFDPSVDISCILFYQAEAIGLLQNGDPFLHDIRIMASLLYTTNERTLDYTGLRQPGIISQESITADWSTRVGQALAHLNQAERLHHAEQHRLAINFLYQSALQVLNALIYTHTGHRTAATCLGQLLRFCDNFCAIRTQLFPCKTREETRLFTILNETRSANGDDDPGMLLEEASGSLLQRVTALHEMAAQYYIAKTSNKPPAMRESLLLAPQ